MGGFFKSVVREKQDRSTSEGNGAQQPGNHLNVERPCHSHHAYQQQSHVPARVAIPALGSGTRLPHTVVRLSTTAPAVQRSLHHPARITAALPPGRSAYALYAAAAIGRFAALVLACPLTVPCCRGRPLARFDVAVARVLERIRRSRETTLLEAAAGTCRNVRLVVGAAVDT